MIVNSSKLIAAHCSFIFFPFSYLSFRKMKSESVNQSHSGT